MRSLLKSRRAWVVAIAVGLGLVLGYWATLPVFDSGRFRFGSKTMAVLRSAVRVEVFRLDADKGPVSHKPKLAGEERIGGWVVTAEGPVKGKEFAGKLARAFSGFATFGTNDVHCFDPGIAFRVHSEKGTIEILICFKCHNLYCGPPTERAKENAGFGAGAWSRLVSLAKEAFPDDKEIQALRD